MAEVNLSQQNFAAGELSPKMRGRIDLPIYANGAERFRNFIAETQGPARFRNGTRFVNNTRRNNAAVLIPFQFNDSQAYVLELTAGYMRFYRNEGIIVETAVNITGATAANPVVITANSHGYSNGAEVYISGVVGMTQLNGRTFIVANKAANTFELTDQAGNNINGSAYTAYSSGGTSEKIYEITTPYLAADLFQIKFGQNADTMYLVHENYEPRKLTRTAHTTWTLSLFTRTSDPFLSKKVITGITQANPGVITSVGHGLVSGDEIIIEGIVGMTELNSQVYTVVRINNDTFSLTSSGVAVNTTSYTAYTSDGYASLRNLLPSAFAFYEGRAVYGGSDSKPETFWLSRSPTSAGVARYDDFTTGTDADHACIFTLAPNTGEVDKIEWLAGTVSFLALGTFGGISKVDGGNEDDSISPTNINVRPLARTGVQDIAPISLGTAILYVQRGALNFYSLEFDVLADNFSPVDRTLVADHITETGIIQLAYINGRPESVWAVRTDGVLLGLTFKSKEDVSGWHRHTTGGTSAKFTSVCAIPRATNYDQLWVVAQRTINGATTRYVEFFEDPPVFPEEIDFYTAATAEDDDNSSWRRAMFELQKEYVHVDSALSYVGTDPGSDAGATITPAAVSGNSVVFTASAAVFAATDVDRYIWKKAVSGAGYGRAKITAYTSSTQVTCQIVQTFDSVTTIAAGNWYLTTGTVSGLWHLEGETVYVIADGAEHSTKTVASGAITLDNQTSVCHVGKGYLGLIKSMPLEGGGINGPAVTKPKNINRVGIKFLNTLGAKFGTSMYHLEEVLFRTSVDWMDHPVPLFTGDKSLSYEDSTENEKHVYIVQDKPLPCTVLAITPFVDVDNF